MKNVLRLSQLISTFGPGSMVDLPTRSVIISGLDRWDIRDDKVSRVISEPRLQRLLEKSMRDAGRLAPDSSIALRTPPVNTETQAYGDPPSVDAMVFPELFVCERMEGDRAGDIRRRRLVLWQALDNNTTKRKYRSPDDDKLVDVSPIRFVGACGNGHIDDIDWRWAVHLGDQCSRPMFLEERGTSGAPADTAVVCECGRRITLQEANIEGRLGKCRGNRPWLGRDKKEECGNHLKLLTRTATNTYFSQVATVISLPQGDDNLARAVDAAWENLRSVESVDELKVLFKLIPGVTGALSGHHLDACFAHILARQREEIGDANLSPRIAEFDLLASGRDVIGNPARDSRLYATTLPRSDWEQPSSPMPLIRNVVAVHRLREVSCIYGFTRVEPAPTIEDDIEEVRLAVSGAPLAETLDWLPAIEQFGEGIFIHIDPTIVEQWLAKPEVAVRGNQLLAGFDRWKAGNAARAKIKYPGLAYVLLHSLSHAMMIEVALESGYPASSIKERIYALQGMEDGRQIRRLGVLIYTASTGAQGTLGGLVGSAPRVVQILVNALARISICSNDPICADHDPASTNDDRSLHGAACHGCLLVAETSCEKRNEFLDRALLIETMASNSASFFE
jgi:hypothetical protein